MANAHHDVTLETGDSLGVTDRLVGRGCTLTFARDTLVYLGDEHEEALRKMLNERQARRVDGAVERLNAIGYLGPVLCGAPHAPPPASAPEPDNVYPFPPPVPPFVTAGEAHPTMSDVEALLSLQPEGVVR